MSTETRPSVRELALVALANHDVDEEARDALHDAVPWIGGWHAAIRYLRRVGQERWNADHPEDDDFSGYLGDRDPYPEEAAAEVLMADYWRAVARLAGWQGDVLPTDAEINDLLREGN